MVQNLATAVINLLTFMALTVATTDIRALMAAVFLFSASLLLEAMTLYCDLKSENSYIIKGAFAIMLAIGLSGSFISIGDYLGFLEFSLVQIARSMRVIMQSPSNSLINIACIDVTDYIGLAGSVSALVPVILACRIGIIKEVRKSYSLNNGFCSK